MSEPLKVEALGPSPFGGMAEFLLYLEGAQRYLAAISGAPVRSIGVDYANDRDQGYLTVMQAQNGSVAILENIALVNSPDDCLDHDFSVRENEFEYCRLCGTSRRIAKSEAG